MVSACQDGSPYIPVSVAARLIRVPARTVRFYVASGDLIAVRSPHQWRIVRADLQRFVSSACLTFHITPRALTLGALMTVAEVSEVSNRSNRTVRGLAETKKLRGFKLGRSWRFWRVDVESLVAERTTKPSFRSNEIRQRASTGAIGSHCPQAALMKSDVCG